MPELHVVSLHADHASVRELREIVGDDVWTQNSVYPLPEFGMVVAELWERDANRLRDDQRVAAVACNDSSFIESLRSTAELNSTRGPFDLLGRIGAREAWQATRGSGVNVAVLDSDFSCSDGLPLQYRASFLRPNDLRGPACHGMQVTALVGRRAIGAEGPPGVAPESNLHLGVVLNRMERLDLVDLVRALHWTLLSKMDVVCMSVGTSGLPGSCCDCVFEKIARIHADRTRCVLVAAVGNDDDSHAGPIMAPAASPGIVAVGALRADRKRYAGSRWNRDASHPHEGVDLGAYVDADPGGSSAACAQVAGAAALLKSLDPSLSPEQVRHYLWRGASGWGNYSAEVGYGALNCARSLQYLQDDMGGRRVWDRRSIAPHP